jgi:hypothetical protein
MYFPTCGRLLNDAPGYKAVSPGDHQPQGFVSHEILKLSPQAWKTRYVEAERTLNA